MKTFSISLLVFMCSVFLCRAQDERDWERQDSAMNRIRYGFSIGGNYSNLQSRHALPDHISIANKGGFRLGLLAEIPLSEKWMFSPKAETACNGSSVRIMDADKYTVTHKVIPVSLEVMSHFVFMMNNRKRTPYLLAGLGLKIPVINRVETSTDFKTKPCFSFDVGIGINNRSKHVIAAPEMRYSFGLQNINTNPQLQSLYFHSVSPVLSFK